MGRPSLVFGIWAVLFAGALMSDRAVAQWVKDTRPIPRGSPLKTWIKPFGDFKYVALLLPMLVIAHPARWRAGAALLLASAMCGMLYGGKWFVGRHRPFYRGELEPFALHPFIDGLPGIFYAKALTFPSGHACLAFAAASCLAALAPRGAAAYYLVAATVAAERVLEGAHYPSDIVAGAALGLCSTWLALRLCDGWFGWHWRRPESAQASPPAAAPVAAPETSAAIST